MKKNIIVTGGLGFIGSNLIELLIKKNFYVTNIDKKSYASNTYNTKEFNNHKSYNFIKCNINNQEKIFNIFAKLKPLAIFNLAAETHVDRSIDNPKVFIKNNIEGVFNLLEAFKRYNFYNKKTKLIHISTDEVYGDIVKGRSDENFKYKPSSPYSASKASSDHIVFSYYKTFKLPLIITNCSNNYGPKQHPEKLIPKLIYNIINNLNLPIYGDGKNSREWIHVKDHCNALYKIFKRGKIGEFYNIGSGLNLNNLKIAKTLIMIAGKHIRLGNKVKIKYVKDRPGHDFRYALNSNKIKKELNWYPIIKFYTGLETTFLWYFKNKNYYKKLNLKDIIIRQGKK